jgi:LuxR family maltose regulon positive regulatory protein
MPLIRPCIASSLWAAGELDQALTFLTPLLEPTPANLESSNFSFVRGTASRIWADRGDAERAERYAREAVAPIIANGTEGASAWGSIWVCLAEALRGTGQLEEARRHMDFGLERELTRPGSVGLGRALISDAELALAERRREQARKSARRAREILEAYPDPGAQLFHRLAAVDRRLAARISDPLPHSPLSGAELRILRELAGGHSRGQIAHDLHLSEDTVKSHLRRIFRRLEVHTSDEAIRAAQARNLI